MKVHDEILSVVADFGAGGCCRADLISNTLHYQRHERSEAIEDLVEADMLVEDGCRGFVTYFTHNTWSEHLRKHNA